jgi:hypothetical protein
MDLGFPHTVVEVPAGPTAGLVDDLWQRPVTDMGLPGPDAGRGGKYLLLGPGQVVPVGADGYIVARSSTFNVAAILRLLPPDAKDRALLSAKIRFYPFSQRADPPQTNSFALTIRESSGLPHVDWPIGSNFHAGSMKNRCRSAIAS